MKRICIIVPTMLGGGMERSMSELANYFVQRGIEVHLVFFLEHDLFYYVHNDIKVHFPDFPYGTDVLSKFVFRLKMFFFQRKILKRIKPDAVLSVPQGYSDLTILASIGLGVPVFVSIRNNPLKKLPWYRFVLRKFLYPIAAGIVAQTDVAKKSLVRFNDNVKVIPNPVRNLMAYPKNIQAKVVLNVGRLVNGKNQKSLIEIFSKTNNEGWELWLVGEGPMKHYLESCISERGLESKVFLKGQVKNIDEILGQSDIFAFTSLSEGYPNSLLEAKAYPLPCISYNCVAGPSDIINDGYDGFLISVGDKQEYLTKLQKLMDDESMRNLFKERGIKTRETNRPEVLGEEYLNFLLSDFK